jgi:enoyl-CoA hydratase/carnithine racemase
MAIRIELGARLRLEVLHDLHRALDVAEHQAPGPVVLAGARGTFCEGLDLASPARDVDTCLATLGSLLDRLSLTSRSVIAVVDGPALGGGLGLAAVADLVIATPRASFALPESLIGLIPAVVFPVVARRIGVAKARVLALGGAPLDAREAHRLSLVDEVAPDPDAELERHARRFACADPRAVAALKALVAQHFGAPDGYRAAAVDAFRALLASDETRARIRRFEQGRSPWDTEDDT